MPFRMMEWNPKTPLQWDWDNLSLFTAGAEAEICRSAQQSEWRVEGGGGIGNGSVHSYTGVGAGNCSGSELGNCSSRSSVSASVDSPAAKAGSCKISGSNFGAGKNKESTSPLLVAASEPLIGLKLGKRTYFEDFCANNSNSSPPLAPAPVPVLALVKNSRVSHRRVQSFHCQVEGCNIDLTPAKDYHRKHRVCESHSKCPKVIVAGLECRFCQQCSRFHELSKFDQKKRSCRRRLSDHNARRRKPQPVAISFNSSGLSSSFYDYGQQMSFLLSRASFGQMRTAAGSSACGFKLSQTKESWIKSPKLGDVDGQLHFPSTEQSKAVSTAEVLNQGLEASVAASNFDGGPDLRRALSLLSTESWSSVDPGSTPVQHTNHPGVVRPALHTLDNTAEYWQDKHQARVLSFDLRGDGSQFQEFQLLKAPYEPALFDSSQMHRYPKSNGRALEFEA